MIINGAGSGTPDPAQVFPSDRGGAWQVTLDGVSLSGGDAVSGIGCLTEPPDGLGMPDLRTEDVSYSQRDGVKHFKDWYEPRIITLNNVTVCNNGCPGCPSAKAAVKEIVRAWSRKCADTELVIRTDCEPQANLFTAGDSGRFNNIRGLTSNGDISTTGNVYRSPSRSLQVTAGSEALLWVSHSDPIPISGGATYRNEIWLNSAATSRQATLWIQWLDSSGSPIGGEIPSGIINTPVGGWGLLTMESQAPSGGAYLETRIQWQGTDPGGIHYVDDWTVKRLTTPEERALVGPFGAIGRPRVATVQWSRSDIGCATLLLRFDAVDHLLYVLDENGTPGSGGSCVTLTPRVDSRCRTYPRCYDSPISPGVSGMCYDTDNSSEGDGPVIATVGGEVCVHPVITLVGPLTRPMVENIGTGEQLTYEGSIAEGSSVVINTRDGTATENGIYRTHLLRGATRMSLDPGAYLFSLTAFSTQDTGHATLCWRPAVESA